MNSLHVELVPIIERYHLLVKESQNKRETGSFGPQDWYKKENSEILETAEELESELKKQMQIKEQ